MPVFKRGSAYGVRAYIKGHRIWLGTWSKAKDAREAERLVRQATGDLSRLPQDALKEAARKIARGEEASVASGLTCDAYPTQWLRDMPRAAETTNNTNHYRLKSFQRDFAGRDLNSITAAEAQSWATKHSQDASAVRAMYNDALRLGLVRTNPFANLRIPRSPGRKYNDPVPEELVDKLAQEALKIHGDYGSTARAVILTAAWTGTRPSELFALEWQDIGEGTLTVRQALTPKRNLKEPKNKQQRTVALPRRAHDAVNAMPRQLRGRWVFLNKRGDQLSKTSWQYHWHAIRAAAHRPDLEFYELRHFCATALIRRGLHPKVIAHQLGHTDGGSLVLELYGHLYEDEALQQVRDAVDSEAKPAKVVAIRAQRSRGSA